MISCIWKAVCIDGNSLLYTSLQLALRATQVRILYESRDPIASPTRAAKAALQKQSRDLLKVAMSVVGHREGKYRVPWQRIASWRDGQYSSISLKC